MWFLLFSFKMCSVLSSYSSTCVVISNDCSCQYKTHFAANHMMVMPLVLRCENVKQVKKLELNTSMLHAEFLSFSINYGSIVLEIPTGCFGDVYSRKIFLQNLGIKNIMKEAFRFHNQSILQNLHLDGNGLTVLSSEVFEGLPTLIYLSITNNKLDRLDDFAFKDLNVLKFLFLDNNRLKIIDRHTFVGLRNLRILSLKGNFLNFVAERSFENLPLLNHLIASDNNFDELHRHLFSNFSELISLDLSINEIEILHEDLLDETTILERLDLSRNNIFQMGGRFLNSSFMLKMIKLHGNPLLKIQNYTFSDLKHLSHLDVADNYAVFDGHQKTFQPKWSLPSNIEYLDLHNSNLSSMTVLMDILERKTHISELRLSKNYLGIENESENVKLLMENVPLLELIDMDSNLIEQINSQTFSNASRLKYIYLQNNRIAKISEYSFFGLSQLEVINVAGNRLRRLDNLTFVSLPRLSSVDLSSNDIYFVDINSFFDCPSLRLLRIHDNKLSSVPYFENNLFNLKILILDNNFIEKFENNSLKYFPNLTFLSASNQMSFDTHYSQLMQLPSDLFKNTPFVAAINLQGCHVKFLSEAFSSVAMDDLHLLNLTRNSLTSLFNNSFSSLSYLVLLDLSYNFISDINPKAFDGLFRLKEVILNHNNIVEMSQLFVSLQDLPQLQVVLASHNGFVNSGCCLLENNKSDNSFINLRTIDISSNNLTKLSPLLDIQQQLGLKILVASNNLLTTVHESFEKHMTFLSELDLSGNRIENGSQIKLASLKKLKIGNFAGNKLNSLHMSFLDGSHASVEKLDLSNNLHLTCQVFQVVKKFINLKILQLSNNNIDCIEIHDNDSFPGSIEELYLGKNKITCESLATGLKYFPSLTYLDFESNHLKKIPKEVLELTKLQVLVLRDNMIHLLHPIEHPPVHLHTLVFSNNVIDSLNESIFDNLSNLRVLDLSSNKLKKLSLPSHLQGLERILLRNNSFKNPSDTPLMSLEFKNLKLIDISSNNLTSEPIDSILTVKSYNSLSIDLSDNKLNSLKNFHFLGIFQTLNFSGNALRLINYEQNGSKWEAEVVDFSRNFIYSLNDMVSESLFLNRVKKLNLSLNRISQIIIHSSELTHLEKLESIDLSRNSLSKLTPSLLDIFPRLRFLFLGGNNFQCSCETQHLMRTASDRRIILSGITCQSLTGDSSNESECMEGTLPWKKSSSTSFKSSSLPTMSPPFSKIEDKPSSQFNWGLVIGLPIGLLFLFVAMAIVVCFMVGMIRNKESGDGSDVSRATSDRKNSEDAKSGVNEHIDAYYHHFPEKYRVAYVKFKDKSLFRSG